MNREQLDWDINALPLSQPSQASNLFFLFERDDVKSGSGHDGLLSLLVTFNKPLTFLDEGSEELNERTGNHELETVMSCIKCLKNFNFRLTTLNVWAKLEFPKGCSKEEQRDVYRWETPESNEQILLTKTAYHCVRIWKLEDAINGSELSEKGHPESQVPKWALEIPSKPRHTVSKMWWEQIGISLCYWLKISPMPPAYLDSQPL